jgi:hypothetical protein
MAFKIGQRVKLIRPTSYRWAGLLGIVTGGPFANDPFGTCQMVMWADGDHRCGIVKDMVPVDDDGDFTHFMERVLKPLSEPVTA